MMCRVMALVLAAVPTMVLAHGGGLDSYGCHHNRKAGGYHCHRGPLAGRSFSSQAEMLQVRQGTKAAPPTPRASGSGKRSAEERLRELNALRDKGLLQPHEYEAKRREILDEL